MRKIKRAISIPVKPKFSMTSPFYVTARSSFGRVERKKQIPRRPAKSSGTQTTRCAPRDDRLYIFALLQIPRAEGSWLRLPELRELLGPLCATRARALRQE